MNTRSAPSECRAPSLSCLAGARSNAMEPPVLESASLRAVLEDLLAQVEVRQVFANRERTAIEAVYTFPVPRGAVLLSFTARIGVRELAARVLPAPQAESEYEEAITDGDAAILLQESAPGLYTVNVGNLLPGERAELTYRYSQLQYWQAGTLRFALPTVIAPRYGDPGSDGLQPHQAPQADLFTHHEVEFRAAVRGALRQAQITSPSHGIAIERDGEQAVVRFDESPARAMDRDIVLLLKSEAAVPAAALVEPAAAGGEHVGLLSFCPELGRPASPASRYVKILVDCSGSMQGDSIRQAREALRRILDSLRPQDWFTIIAFGSTYRFVTAEAVPGTPAAVAAAREAVRTVHASLGGTELGAALLAALDLRAPDGQAGDVLLVTDGEVFDGQLVAKARRKGGRVFTVGVGCAPGESLLARLAEQTGGAAEFVTPGDDVAGRIHRHFRRLYQPRVRSLTVRWPGACVEERRDRDGGLFAGDTVHLFARLRGDVAGDVTVRCELDDGQVVSTTAPLRRLVEAPAALPEAGYLERLLGAAELRAALDREPEAATATAEVARLTALAVRCQLPSRWTSCLMVAPRADGEKTDGQPDLRRVRQMLAAGWGGAGSEVRCMMDAPLFCRMSNASLTDGVVFAKLMGAAPRTAWSLAGLANLGLPPAVLDELRRLVEGGDDESAVCLLALLELLRTGPKPALPREQAREARRDAKLLAMREPDLAVRVAAAVAAGVANIS